MTHDCRQMSDEVDLRRVAETLRAAYATLRGRTALGAPHLLDDEVAEVVAAILALAGSLDDSISNPHLGSLFDRTARDPLNTMADLIAKAYGVAKTYPGTTGTTGLNVPAVMTLAAEREVIAIARDCHVSVIGGLCLSGATPVYLEPPWDHERGVLLPPAPAEIAALLERNPGVRALVVTMPTYHGLMGDVAGIVRVCHRRGVRVMVDEAHGPHLRFLRQMGFSACAEDAGADVVTQSVHKVMSALNQASLLHFNDATLARRYEEMQALGFQSTSFSYPLLLSLERAVRQITEEGQESWRRALGVAERLREGARRLPGVTVLDDRVVDGRRVTGMDRTRVTLNVRGTGRSGYDVGNALTARGQFVEMATSDVVLFLVCPSVDEAQVDTTLRHLGEILTTAMPSVTRTVLPPLPERVLTPRAAVMWLDRERVRPKDAIGRVSAETIGAYPPGQAIFVAGERISAEGVAWLQRVVDEGGHLKRVQDDHFASIEVLRGV